MAEATNSKDAGEQPPSTVAQQAPAVSEDHAPSTSEPVATDIPSANTPDPNAANAETNPNAAAAKNPKAAKAGKADAAPEGEAKPAAKAAKKEKAPAVEDKPFKDFVEQDYLPALKAALAKQAISDLNLNFTQQKLPITGLEVLPECWQIVGSWNSGRRRFNIYFFKEDIQGQRGFSYSESSGRASVLEPFLIDERKVTLDLLVFGAIQRLNAQKWLTRN